MQIVVGCFSWIMFPRIILILEYICGQILFTTVAHDIFKLGSPNNYYIIVTSFMWPVQFPIHLFYGNGIKGFNHSVFCQFWIDHTLRELYHRVMLHLTDRLTNPTIIVINPVIVHLNVLLLLQANRSAC